MPCASEDGGGGRGFCLGMLDQLVSQESGRCTSAVHRNFGFPLHFELLLGNKIEDERHLFDILNIYYMGIVSTSK